MPCTSKSLREKTLAEQIERYVKTNVPIIKQSYSKCRMHIDDAQLRIMAEDNACILITRDGYFKFMKMDIPE